MDTDFKTVQKVKDGNIQEFQFLYKKYQNKIFIYFLSRVCNREDALDLTMDTFERVIQFINSFREDSIFKTWLYGIAKNVLFSYYTKKKIDPISISSLDFENEEALDVIAFQENIKSINSQSDSESNYKNEKAVEKILENLPHKYSEILRMRYLFNYSVRDISIELGITENNAKVSLFRSLEKAKKIASNLVIEELDYLNV